MRIITGKAKGLKLKTPSGFNTRPTADRVKESLFNVLNGMIDFSEVDSVLDVFAGTGSLGLEAVSRGASAAFFIDSTTGNLIEENIKRAKFENCCKVFRGDFVNVLKNFSRQALQFDLIFGDPPYHKNLSQKLLNLVGEMNLLKNSGLVVIEHGIDENFQNLPDILECVRKISYGRTTGVSIYGIKNF